MVTRIAGAACRRNGAPGITAQPSDWRAWTTVVSSGTGIQTFRPVGASTSMPWFGQGIEECVAALAVGGGGSLQLTGDLLVLPQLRRGALE